MNATALKQKARYQIGLAMSGEDVAQHFGETFYVGLETLCSEGNTIAELVANATINTTDQDGCEFKLVQLTDMSEKFIKQCAERMADQCCDCSCGDDGASPDLCEPHMNWRDA